MGYEQEKMPSGWAPSGRLAKILSHRWFKTILVAIMVFLLALVLALSLLISRVKGQSRPESQTQVEGQAGVNGDSGITLTVSTDGGNASSPLLYGIMFEVRHIVTVPFVQTVILSSRTNPLL